MCNFWTCIITEDGNVHHDPDSSSHETLIKRLKLDDGEADARAGKPYNAAAINRRKFVRLEITPNPPLGIASKRLEDWALKVDEEGTLPEWFTANRPAMEAAAWKAWRKAMSETLWKLHIERLPALIKEIKAIKYFSQNSPPNPEWHMNWNATWDAARTATWDATWDAARTAARDATWDAARDAAWNATCDAARTATCDAARDAAWNALIKILPKSILKEIDPKHIAHINARMEVWKKGYGLLCDVNGVLYCYGVKNPEATEGRVEGTADAGSTEEVP